MFHPKSIYILLPSMVSPRCAARCAQMTEGDREAINGIYRRPRGPAVR